MMDISGLRPIGRLRYPPLWVGRQFRGLHAVNGQAPPFQPHSLVWQSIPITKRPCPATMPRPASILAPKLTGNGNGGALSAPPTCPGNGNEGATGANLSGNRIEGAPAHVFNNFARCQAKSAASVPNYPDKEMMAPPYCTWPEIE